MKRNKSKQDNRTELLFPLGPQIQPEPLVKLDQPVWTRNKSALIARYLRYFVFITKHGTYIDPMAGPQYPHFPEYWSARRVLENQPAWLRNFFLFELHERQFARLETMVSNQQRPANHTVVIKRGDCNILIPELLATRPIRDSEATFCLLDQRTFECAWSTVEVLARYKPEGAHKIELFYFLPNWWLPRAIAGTTRNAAAIQRWWGREDWMQLRSARNHERAELFVHRFKDELGYKSAKPWPIWDRQGGRRLMYYMIHATDHPEAPKLMSRAYNSVVNPVDESPEQLGLLEWLGSGSPPDDEI